MWKSNDEQGIGSTLGEMQEAGRVKMDQSFVGKRIELLSQFDWTVDGKKETAVRWCAGVVEAVSDGTWPTWRKTPRGTACWKEGEAARVMWDPIPDGGIDEYIPSVEEFNPNNWNQNTPGAWRREKKLLIMVYNCLVRVQ